MSLSILEDTCNLLIWEILAQNTPISKNGSEKGLTPQSNLQLQKANKITHLREWRWVRGDDDPGKRQMGSSPEYSIYSRPPGCFCGEEAGPRRQLPVSRTVPRRANDNGRRLLLQTARSSAQNTAERSHCLSEDHLAIEWWYSQCTQWQWWR